MDKTKLTFLGTCAADFSPRLKGEFAHRFDRDARRSSCMLIGESRLIDCGVHCAESLEIAGKDFAKITDIFITHFHRDHFAPECVERIVAGREKPLRLWCRRDAVLPEIPHTEVIRMEEGKRYALGDMTAEGMDANHDEASFPQHYLFEIRGKKFLYACDGAWFLTRTYNRLKGAGLSLLVLDATCGDYAGDYRMAEHNSLPMIRLMLPSLKTAGIIGDATEIYLSHIAPSLHLPHEQLCMLAAVDGLKVAYDGMEIFL